MRHVGMADCAVASYAVTGHHGRYRRFGACVVGSGHGEEQAISIMAGGAGVMDLVVSGAQRDAGCRANRGSMATGAFR